MNRTTGHYLTTTTLNESVKAFFSSPCRRRQIRSRPCSSTSNVSSTLMMPRLTIEHVKQGHGTTFPTANTAVKTLTDLGILNEMTGQKKNRSFGYQSYIALLSK